MDIKEVYARYQPLVRAVLFRLGHREDLDDLVQETFLKLWKNQDSFRHDASEKTWVYRITINTGIDGFRKKKKSIELVEEKIEEKKNWEEGAINRDLVLKGMGLLSVKHRAVMVLQVWENLSAEEISEVLKISLGTVKSRIYYARQVLEDFFRKNGIDI